MTNPNIPVVKSVDVLVIGGGVGGVEAAVAAAGLGADAYVAASRNYLGYDACDTYRLWLEPGERAVSPVARAIFDGGRGPGPVRPLRVKYGLDRALLDAGVDFRFGCYPTGLLRDEDGHVCGGVFASRSGRWAVTAKVILDTGPRALAARMAGCAFKPYPPGAYAFRRIVVGGEPVQGLACRALPEPVRMPKHMAAGKAAGSWPAVEYALSIEMRDGSLRAFQQAEVEARLRTWSPGQVDAAGLLFHIPPDTLCSRAPFRGDWAGADALPLDALTADGRVFVVGPCADVPPGTAEAMLRPVAAMAVGARIGRYAAETAAGISQRGRVSPARISGSGIPEGEVHEVEPSYRPLPPEPRSIEADAGDAPFLGEFDVVVAGGGTGGAPAAVTAARGGARTLVIESLNGLGGVGTLGLITSYCHGSPGGFTAEIDAGVDAMTRVGSGEGRGPHDIEGKSTWFCRALQNAGAEIWYGTLCYGARVEGARVSGVLAASLYGCGWVSCQTVIDATGNADVAAAAGAPCVTTGGEHIAVQGTGLAPRTLGIDYSNSDHTFVDDCDLLDTWSAMVVAHAKYCRVYDLSPIVNSRQRRQIVGEFTLSPLDILCGRTFPDTIVTARSNFDSHGYTVHPVFALKPPDRRVLLAHVPYRCLLPRGLDGILVLGLGVSTHRDAMPIIRMQPDIQNQGYAAGLAAVAAVRAGTTVRQINVRALQQQLATAGVLNREVLQHEDSFPLPTPEIEAAVRRVANDFDGVAAVLTAPELARPLLRRAYVTAADEGSRLIYAQILATLGDDTGTDALVRAVRSRDWDEGWNFTGMGQFGRSMSPVDDLLVALGRTGSDSAVEPVLEKLRLLNGEHAFSHFRAIAMALEVRGDPRAGAPLAELLSRPGIRGHAFLDIEDAIRRTPRTVNDNTTRNLALRELVIARALYRCGDPDGVGATVLREYARDLRAHFANHARAVLAHEARRRSGIPGHAAEGPH